MIYRSCLRSVAPLAFVALAFAAQGCASSQEDPTPKQDEASAVDDRLDEAGEVAPQCTVMNCYTCPDNGEEICGPGVSQRAACNAACVADCVRTDTYCL